MPTIASNKKRIIENCLLLLHGIVGGGGHKTNIEIDRALINFSFARRKIQRADTHFRLFLFCYLLFIYIDNLPDANKCIVSMTLCVLPRWLFANGTNKNKKQINSFCLRVSFPFTLCTLHTLLQIGFDFLFDLNAFSLSPFADSFNSALSFRFARSPTLNSEKCIYLYIHLILVNYLITYTLESNRLCGSKQILRRTGINSGRKWKKAKIPRRMWNMRV